MKTYTQHQLELAVSRLKAALDRSDEYGVYFSTHPNEHREDVQILLMELERPSDDKS